MLESLLDTVRILIEQLLPRAVEKQPDSELLTSLVIQHFRVSSF